MPPRNNPLPTAVLLFNCAICDKGYSRQLDYENHLRSYDHNHRQRLADMKRITANNDPDSAKPKQGPEMRSISVEEAGKMPGVGGRFKKVGGMVEGASAGGNRFKKVGVAVAVVDVKKEEEEKKRREDAKKVERERREAERLEKERKEAERMEEERKRLEEERVRLEEERIRHEEERKRREEERKRLEEERRRLEEERREMDRVVQSVEQVDEVPMDFSDSDEVSDEYEESEQEETSEDGDTLMVENKAEEEVPWEQYDFTKPTGCDHATCPGCKTEGIWSGKWVQVGTVRAATADLSP